MKKQMNEGFQLIHDMMKLRWIPEIIESIHSGHHGYNEILHNIDFLSNTELNRKLAVLLDRKAIEKVDRGGRDGYVLTPFGKDLEHIFNHFVEMGERYLS